jgi:hypothetical protein
MLPLNLSPGTLVRMTLVPSPTFILERYYDHTLDGYPGDPEPPLERQWVLIWGLDKRTDCPYQVRVSRIALTTET